MSVPYRGPLRDEPLAVELHNTLYVDRGEPIDGLDVLASAEAWLTGVADRLPAGGRGGGPKRTDLVDLRQIVRDALRAVVDGTIPSAASIEGLNRHSARAPRARVAAWHADSPPVGEWDFGRASRADVVLSAIAADAIQLVTGPDAANVRICGAPGCVLMFVKGHARREWCSGSCGNRARQARHYRRVRERGSTVSE